VRVTLVHNPKSGKHETPGPELLELLSAAGHEAVYHSTKKGGWKKALREPADLVVAAGGDGTVAKVLKQLAGRHIPVAILPTGTSNNIATTLGVSGTPEELIGRWNSAKITPFDLGVMSAGGEDCTFAEAFGLGLFARFLKLAKKRNRDGKKTAKGSGPGKPRSGIPLMLDALERLAPRECTMSLDGRDASGDYLMVEVMNIRAIGGRLAFAPGADPGDGSFDVVTVRTSERAALAEFLRAHEAGRDQPKRLRCVRARSLHMVCTGSDLHLDDVRWPDGGKKRYQDPQSGLMDIKVRVQPGAAQVLL
jgi:diacylglycerol kinase (ATP)